VTSSELAKSIYDKMLHAVFRAIETRFWFHFIQYETDVQQVSILKVSLRGCILRHIKTFTGHHIGHQIVVRAPKLNCFSKLCKI
jgi:hypothetical protein